MKTSDKILTFTAVFISCLALVVSIVQTRILQDQSQASVWPRLTTGQSVGPDYFRILAENEGVGPAIVRSVKYTYKDTTFQYIDELYHHIGDLEVKETQTPIRLNFGFSNPYEGGVFGVGDLSEIFIANDSLNVEIAKRHFSDLSVEIEYCSIYGKCWRLKDLVTEELK